MIDIIKKMKFEILKMKLLTKKLSLLYSRPTAHPSVISSTFCDLKVTTLF